jgi:hypothetical protein
VISGADGLAINGATLNGSGTLALDGVDDYVNLPNGLISRWPSVSVVAWVNWTGAGSFPCLWDFGTSSAGEDLTGTGTSYFAVSPEYNETLASGGLSLLTRDSTAGAVVATNLTLPSNRMGVVAATFDGASGNACIYYYDAAVPTSGTRFACRSGTFRVSRIQDLNMWVGRSQLATADELAGTYEELRIYNVALTQCAVRSAADLGPNNLNLTCD